MRKKYSEILNKGMDKRLLVQYIMIVCYLKRENKGQQDEVWEKELNRFSVQVDEGNEQLEKKKLEKLEEGAGKER